MARNMATGEPSAKKFSGANVSCGYLTKGHPTPVFPITYATEALFDEDNKGSLKHRKL